MGSLLKIEIFSGFAEVWSTEFLSKLNNSQHFVVSLTIKVKKKTYYGVNSYRD
jgi:hypothetical protein